MKSNQFNNTVFSHEKFRRLPAVGIVRGLSLDQFKRLLPAYIQAGFTSIEVTMNTENYTSLIGYALDSYAGQLNIGVGTVCSKADLETVLQTGVQFIVTPIVAEEVITECVNRNIPVFPGALTPSEIYRAWQLGATMVKVYPATSLGAGYIRDVKAPMPAIKMMPTGGIHAGNIENYFSAGADAVGLGSALFDTRILALNSLPALENHFTGFARLVSQLSNPNK